MRTALLPTLAALLLAVLVTLVVVVNPAAQAATLFGDDFNDGDAAGWATSGGSWSVVGGLSADGSSAYRQASTGADAKAQAGQLSWSDYTVQARVNPLAWGSNAGRFAGVLARAQNMTNYYYLALTGGQLVLGRRTSGTHTTLAAAPAPVAPGSWHTLALAVTGPTLRGSLDGQSLVTATDGTLSAGRVGLAGRYASAAFDDLLVDDVVPPTDPPTSPPPSSPPPAGDCQVAGTADGFASVDAWGQDGTTGGAGGPTVEVDTASELLSAIGAPGPLTVCLTGMITLPPGMYDVASDKSIVGLGAGSGITGGGFNVGLPADDGATAPPAGAVHNVIIQNLVFRGANDDSINVQMFSHHVWIDHNDLAGGFDGLVDIKRGSSYVTVSWNHTHDHTKNMLLGHSDGNAAQDVGRLKVTYHHNWFDRTPQRNPRVRFGEPVHVFNNYYVRNSDAGVACQADAGCLVEGNYFEDVEEPVTNHYSGPTGRCVARGNVFVGEEAGEPDCSGTVEEPSGHYPYVLDPAAEVRALVIAGAGVGKVG